MMGPSYRFAMDKNVFDSTVDMVVYKKENGIRYRAKIEWVEDVCDPVVRAYNDDSHVTLRLDGESDSANNFIKSMYEDLRHFLKKGKNDPTINGLQVALETQKAHLEDMRKLVFEGNDAD